MYILLPPLVLFITLLLLEKKQPFLKDPPSKTHESMKTNLQLFVMNELFLSIFSVSSLFYIAENYSDWGLLANLDNIFLKQIVAFLLLDLLLYLWHRMDHTFMFLWSFHQVHHSDQCLNVSTALRFHIGALLLNTVIKAFAVVLIGIDAWTITFYECLIMLFVLIQHSNIKIPGERTLAYLFITPDLHRVHHSTSLKQRDKNFGVVFSIWDRLFATYENTEAKGIGLTHLNGLSLLKLTRLGFLDAVKSLKLFKNKTSELHAV